MRLVPMLMERPPYWLDVAEKPDKVWMWAGENCPPPEHPDLSAAVEMHEMHDWKWREGRMRYFYSTDARAWILLQYGTEPNTRTCAACARDDVPACARFCCFCGASLD